MKDMEQGLNNRLRTVAALAVLRDGAEAAALADYLPEAEQQAVAELIGGYGREPETGFAMEQLVRQMVASERFSSIAEVHPAWILEHLREEPPRVIGIILRSLPSKHVRYVLEHLPPMIKAQLPDMVESFSVQKPVLETIRRRFERHFLPMRASRSLARMGFEHLYYLKGAELEEVIRDAGLSELAIALAGMQGKTLHVVFNRLDLKDAKRLQRKIRETGSVSSELARQARYTILEVEGNHVGPERMLMRVGLAALASAMEREHGHLVRLLMQKLVPADGYLLKRSIDERRLRLNAVVAAERRAIIMNLVDELAAEGRIDPSWRRLLATRESTEPAIPLASADEEETATIHAPELA